MADMVERLVPTSDAARSIGISAQTLARWVRERRVKPTLVTAGGHLRWEVEDLRRQLREMWEAD